MIANRLLMAADAINQNFSDYTLLDVGCRTMDLKPLLSKCQQYSGTDFVAGEGIYECNLEKGLPFEDKQFDVVVALDVLEHLENAHHTFHDLLRVAKKAVIISLPNMYHWQFRLRFLLKGSLSNKYKFPVSPIMDRHRWILSYSEADAFIRHNAPSYRVESYPILPNRGRSKKISEPLEKQLCRKFPDMFAYGSFFVIRPNSD